MTSSANAYLLVSGRTESTDDVDNNSNNSNSKGAQYHQEVIPKPQQSNNDQNSQHIEEQAPHQHKIEKDTHGRAVVWQKPL
jgi:hypothetical protein